MRFLQHLDSADRESVLALVSTATDFDGVPPIAEHILLHLRHGGDTSDSHLLLEVDDQLVGYAHLDLTDLVEGPSVEMVIHPRFRGQGYAQSLLNSVLEVAGEGVRLWAHGDTAPGRELAAHNGFQRIRTVMQMRRSLSEPLSAPNEEISIRTFQPDMDNAEWVALNNRAFEGHPDQGDWDLNDLLVRTKEDWFDPEGFFVAEVDGSMAAFCWTKIHGGHSHSHDGENDLHDHDPIGEIYIMGVDPTFAGRGLGRAVTLAGLRYLRQNAIFSAMLYVDADNDPAVRLYKSLGFTEYGTDVMYRLKAD